MTAALLLSAFLQVPMVHGHSLPEEASNPLANIVNAFQCDMNFVVSPAANDAERLVLAAMGTRHFANYAGGKVRIYLRDPMDPSQDGLLHEFDEGFDFEIVNLEMTSDNEFLILKSHNQSRIYRIQEEVIRVFDLQHQGDVELFYDRQRKQVSFLLDTHLRAYDLREKEYVMVTSTRRPLIPNLMNLLYSNEEFLFERLDPSRGRLLGVMNTNLKELRWFPESELLPNPDIRFSPLENLRQIRESQNPM